MVQAPKSITCFTSTAQELRVQFPELHRARDSTLLLLFDTAMRTFVENIRKTLWSVGASHLCVADGERQGKVSTYRVEGGWGAASIEVTYANIDPCKGEMWLMAEKAVFVGDARGTRMLFSAFNGVCRSANFSGLRRVIEE